MSQPHPPPYASAAATEAAFYAAFEARDPVAMQAVWSAGEDIVCIHPSGPALRGWPAIERSWRSIFEGIGDARFVLSDVQVFDQPALCVHFVHENIHHGPGFTGISRVLATNVYRRESDGWRMVSHHGSPGGIIHEPDGVTDRVSPRH
jgi:ketosteroid isomerase-like protein